MFQIRCENKRYDNSKKLVKCNKLLLCVSDEVIENLYLNEDAKIITSCHSCRGNRFSEIKVEDGKLKIKSVDLTDVKSYKNLKYDEVNAVEEVRMED